jgi:opacity protein-like surface antigen
MHVFTRVLLTAIAAIPVVPSTGSAQVAAGVYVGARIRSSAGTGWRGTGTVLQAGSDSLVVNSDATGTPIVLRRADMERLEIRDGERRSTEEGFLVGALVGAGAGAILGFAAGDQKCTAEEQADVRHVCPPNPNTAREVAVSASIFLGVLGASVGALTGYRRTSEQWVAVGANKVAVSPIIGGDGHLGVSLRF